MNTINTISYGCMAAIPGIVIGAVWKEVDFKDLSVSGACRLGYGHEGILNHILQTFNIFKDQEKHSSQRWNVIAIPIAANILCSSLIKEDGSCANLKEIPHRCLQALKDNARTMSFTAATIPLYSMARSLKNIIWTGHDFDPSGHVMFKVIQQGLMISTMNTNNHKLKMLNSCFILLNVIADTVMLANTVANCHTLNEAIIGASIGVEVLTTAFLISHYSKALFSNFWPFSKNQEVLTVAS